MNAAAKSLRSCPTLCDPIDGGPPGSFVPRILQARVLEFKNSRILEPSRERKKKHVAIKNGILGKSI